MHSSDEQSPCTNICKLDPTSAFCIGCGRTTQDIGGWMNMSRAEKLQVKEEARQRLATYLKQTLKS